MVALVGFSYRVYIHVPCMNTWVPRRTVSRYCSKSMTEPEGNPILSAWRRRRKRVVESNMK